LKYILHEVTFAGQQLKHLYMLKRQHQLVRFAYN